MYSTAGACAFRVHPEEIRSLGRSVRRTFFSALIDRTVTPTEMRHELLSLILGWPATVRHQARPERPRVIALWGRLDREGPAAV